MSEDIKEKGGLDISDLLDDENLEAWVIYSPEVDLKIRFITEDLLWDLTDKAKDKNGKVDRRKLRTLIAMEAVQDWRGLVYKGKELPVNRENIKKLSKKLTGLSNFIETAATEYVLLKNFRLAEEKKISENGSELEPSTSE